MALSRHHLWWPRRDYKGPPELLFRNLPCNTVLIDDRIHAALHMFSQPPTKPNHNHMHMVIERHRQGQCGCSAKERGL